MPLKWRVWKRAAVVLIIWDEACNMSSLITCSWQTEGVAPHNTPLTKEPRTTGLDLSHRLSEAEQHWIVKWTQFVWFGCSRALYVWDSANVRSSFSNQIRRLVPDRSAERQKGNVAAVIIMPCYWIIANIPNESWAKADRALKLPTESSCRILSITLNG